jgi:hypothetical protein
MAEIELNVLTANAAAWQKNRNKNNAIINWQFTTNDARIKLARLYPSIDG